MANYRIIKIDVKSNLSGRKIMEFPNCVNRSLTIVCILFLFRNIHSLIQKRAFKKGHIYNMKKDIIHKVFFDNFLVRKKSERKKPFFVCIKEVELKIRLVFVFLNFSQVTARLMRNEEKFREIGGN